ncbi:MAG TPA: DUF3822 family protein [Ferruginibacter sp.]|nr:DUF3822 family protein [Ferruginibacter sp.]HMP22070.1 DUF3822 family protein [Ferruginibacter sp.]
MTPSFEIHAHSGDTAGNNLFLEVGLQGISYFITDDATQACTALAVYHLPQSAGPETAAAALRSITEKQEILQEPFKKVNIIYAYPYSVLVPYQYMQDDLNNDVLQMLYGDAQDMLLKKDYLYRHQLYNIYGVPQQVNATIEYLLTADNYVHCNTLLTDITTNNGNTLYCIFKPSCFTAMLKKNGKLQIIQNFNFKTPEDVAYYLLQLCQAFEVPAEAVELTLCGMIDAVSPLYKEISKYFLRLEFGQLPGNYTYPESMQQYPAHFFSHHFAMASCV